MTDDGQWPDRLRLQLDRKARMEETGRLLEATRHLPPSLLPPGHVARLEATHTRAVEAYERGERGLA